MNIIQWTEFKRMAGVDEIVKSTPSLVTFDGEVVGIFANPDLVITLEDLAPRIKAQLRGLELKARAGMPDPAKIVAKKAKSTLPQKPQNLSFP